MAVLKSYPLVARFLFFFLLPSTLFLLAGWQYLSASLPQESGEFTLPGITAPVSISRDEHGVAFIEAEKDLDAFFAMGFVHAQDRLWQLEIQRRVAAGRMSEVFGRKFIRHDVWMRTLGLTTEAVANWDALSEDARASLTAYAAGINAWVASGARLPPEFDVFGIEFEPWRETDSLAWAKMFALNLANNLWSELQYLTARKALSDAQFGFLFQTDEAYSPVTVPGEELIDTHELARLYDIRDQLELDLQIGGKYVGSNAWVVAGSHTLDGAPLLANDPHLSLQMPSLWYVVKQTSADHDVTGMSLVGLPLVIFGKNTHIAWGGTNMMADVQDLYYVQVNPDNPDEYLLDERWVEFETRVESIDIKADFPASLNKALAPVEIEVRSTVHGPVISDVVSSFERPIALSWTALKTPDTTYESFYRLQYAKNWRDFEAAMSHHVAPALNMLYSDVEGNIGYLGVGRIPVRAVGEGRSPLPGWSHAYQWQSYIPLQDMPRSFNPAKGYLVSANNKVVDADFPYFISHDWSPPARARRIEQLLETKIRQGERISIADMNAMQADTVDLGVADLLDLIKTLTPENETQKSALEYIHAWQGDMRGDSQAASIYYVWMRHVREQLFFDELTGYWNRNGHTSVLETLGRELTDAQVYAALRRSEAPDEVNWCDDVATERSESCDQILKKALNLALHELKKLAGSDMQAWTWGAIHSTHYAHQPFSHVRAIDTFFERKVHRGGSPNTINLSNARLEPSEGYTQDFGAGFRQIIKVSSHDPELLYMNSTGQSGHALSAHYDDMIEPFNAATLFALPENKDNNRSTLTLVPR